MNNVTLSVTKKVLLVAFSNIVKLLSSVLVGFVIPKLLGVNDYGYYRIFTLYLTYSGLLHFGFIDGIYLKYGGVDYNNLDRRRFLLYTKFIFSLETGLSITGVLFAFFVLKGEQQFIFMMLSVNLFATNVTTYYQFISQITGRFKEYSFRMFMMSALNVLIVCLMLLLKLKDYHIYVYLTVASNYLLMFWYMFTYSRITVGQHESLDNNVYNLFELFKLGIPLLLSNLIIIFIEASDKQIVQFFFDVSSFGIYSFAFSALSLVTAVVSAIGVVLYPVLKQKENISIQRTYSLLNAIVISIVAIGMVSYFPVSWVISQLLPEYTDSIPIFRIALPGLLFISSITVVKHNYFKITGKNYVFLWIGILIFIASLISHTAMYFLFHEKQYVTISYVLWLSVWYMVTEWYMAKAEHINWKKNALAIISALSLYYFVTGLSLPLLFTGLLYGISEAILIGILYSKDILWMLKGVRR